MRSFQDNAGRTWTVALNVAAIKRVRALTGVDLANIITLEPGQKPKMEVLERLASDSVLLVDVLYAVCKGEADTRKVTDIDFGTSMAGDAIELATTALIDELIDFFPTTKRRVLQKIIAATRRFEAKTKNSMDQILDNPELEKNIDAELERLMN